MDERNERVKADVLILRSLTELDGSNAEAGLVTVGISEVLINLKNRSANLRQIYQGVVELAVRLGDSWDEALMLTRGTAAQGSSNPDMQAAYEKLLRDTAHLYGR